MSKLIDNIVAETTGRRSAGRPELSMLSVEGEMDPTHPVYTEYKVAVTLGCNIRTDKLLALKSKYAESPVRQVALMIEQEVFGEFREDIHAIYRALWVFDCERAAKLLQHLENRMFSAREIA